MQYLKNLIFCVVIILSVSSTSFAAGEERLVFDPKTHTLTHYGPDGEMVARYPAVGGADWCPDVRRPCRSPVGTFRIISKHGPGYRSGTYPLSCRNKARCGARMPYLMKFTSRAGIHAGRVPRRNVSHGCVRVPLDVAKELSRVIPVGTPVIVHPYR